MAEEPQGQQPGEPGQQGGLMNSISMAFNLGVSENQRGGHGSVAEAANEIRNTIYENLSQAYGNQHQEAFLQANTEYFLQIALLGYIIPSVCYFDEGFKDSLFQLIEKKLQSSQAQGQQPGQGGPQSGGAPGGGGIVTP